VFWFLLSLKKDVIATNTSLLIAHSKTFMQASLLYLGGDNYLEIHNQQQQMQFNNNTVPNPSSGYTINNINVYSNPF